MKNRQKFLYATISASTAAALFAGCSTSDDEPTTPSASMEHGGAHSAAPTSSSESATHNAADVTFNQMMIPHHEQAVEMAGLVRGRSTDPALLELATRIADAQQPEIDEMTARLSGWGIDAAGGGHAAGGHEGHDMSGMMSESDMSALTAARGAEFDRLWLEGMIRHHQGAVEMADDELASGIDGPSRALAEQVRKAQQAEIDEMRRMLGQ
ncbi:DUF305 domain-containing protein [Gordonia sp. ABSL11-1]|uniref:DUF305 domain-containing protein n=1 Tax=Gordonia sp. ABSL11-1 TaxID=3053924 RepID=UPI002572D7CC|nr:DUF305 domain-containing protein [Gordonia sp. ABSL11-1]MDL9946637.1 DUF305 domain-containing protein [Gordonia sp. ABSL11-1]